MVLRRRGRRGARAEGGGVIREQNKIRQRHDTTHEARGRSVHPSRRITSKMQEDGGEEDDS